MRGDDLDILITCALRFDGWAYKERTGWEHEPALDRIIRDGEFPTDANELLCLFFLLQRGLCKWDLVYEASDSRYWWALRELFFRAYRLAVPDEYRNEEYANKWERELLPRLDEAVEAVRHVHRSIRYAAGPKLDPEYVRQVDAMQATQKAPRPVQEGSADRTA